MTESRKCKKSVSIRFCIGIAGIELCDNNRDGRQTRKAAYFREHRKQLALWHEQYEPMQGPGWPAADYRICVGVCVRATVVEPDHKRDDGSHRSKPRTQWS